MRRAVVAAAFAVIPLAALPARAASVDMMSVFGATPPKAAAIYDVKEQRFLGAFRDRRPLPPASLLKMLTALVVSDRLLPTNELVISRRAASADADRVIWREGARFTVDQVLHGLLMESSNGAAFALAERAYASMVDFREHADRIAARLGATHTRLVDPSGLDAPGQRSTARDLALIANAVLADPWLSKIVRTDRYRLPWSDGRTATFNNANPYLARDPSAIGVKNGFTSKARNTVAAASERGGRTHIVVVLGGPDPFDQARWLMDLAFELAPGDREPIAPVNDEALTDRPHLRPVSQVAAAAPVPQSSPTLARFFIGLAYAATVLGLVRANRRRTRTLRRLVLIGSRPDTLRAWDPRSQSSRPHPSSKMPRAPAVQRSPAPRKQTASSGRSRASLKS